MVTDSPFCTGSRTPISGFPPFCTSSRDTIKHSAQVPTLWITRLNYFYLIILLSKTSQKKNLKNSWIPIFGKRKKYRTERMKFSTNESELFIYKKKYVLWNFWQTYILMYIFLKWNEWKKTKLIEHGLTSKLLPYSNVFISFLFLATGSIYYR